MEAILRRQNVMWPDSQEGQNSSRQTPSCTDFQADRTKRKQNQELTEPIVNTILGGQNLLWPDSQVDKIQVDKHPVWQNPT